MPAGTPRLGLGGLGSKILGAITDTQMLDPTPQGENTQWEGVTVSEPPPPWELNDGVQALSDARRFVEVPDNLEVRWINPKVINAMGWRDWQAVMASDPRFKVLTPTMISPENTIRRGGEGGDILAWMYKSWVLSRRKQNAKETAARTQSAVDQQAQLTEDSKRGKFGRNVTIDSASHPQFTMGDGKSMKD